MSPFRMSVEAARRELGGIVERMGLVAGEAALPTLLAEFDRVVEEGHER